ncbi:DNA-binding protein [Lysobacter tyrosinilyticus]
MKRDLKSPAQLAAGGPLSIDQIRWLIFRAKDNGLDSAICRIGRRVYLDVDAFDAWLQTRNPALRPIERNAQAGAA